MNVYYANSKYYAQQGDIAICVPFLLLVQCHVCFSSAYRKMSLVAVSNGFSLSLFVFLSFFPLP